MSSTAIEQERLYRERMWNALLEQGGPKKLRPGLLSALKLYGGGAGIWVDKARTGSLTQDEYGIAVSLTLSGKSYSDDWSEDGVIYQYPQTQRPAGRDRIEIEATKNAGKQGVPIFIVKHTPNGRRDVSRGWVAGWDDVSKQFLIVFDNDLSPGSSSDGPQIEEVHEDSPFSLWHVEQGKQRTIAARQNQQRFKFHVFQRYGPQCAVCDMGIAELLQAAHLVPKEYKGSDDPRNGLVLCANHHLAFDAGFFAIHPESLALCYTTSGPGARAMQVIRQTLHHLPRPPHVDALRWRYTYWARHEKTTSS